MIKISNYVVILLLIIVGVMHTQIKSLNKSLDLAVNNNRAYKAQNDELKNENLVFKLTSAELKCANDSITLKLKESIKKLNIKERKIAFLQYQLTSIHKQDTIFVKDTIFKNPGFSLDTCLTDKWSKTCLSLEYPNRIGISSEFINETSVIAHYVKVPRKERKWFLPKLFTKKIKTIVVEIDEKNPYAKTKKQKYIQKVD